MQGPAHVILAAFADAASLGGGYAPAALRDALQQREALPPWDREDLTREALIALVDAADAAAWDRHESEGGGHPGPDAIRLTLVGRRAAYLTWVTAGTATTITAILHVDRGTLTEGWLEITGQDEGSVARRWAAARGQVAA